ncbi:hypothetical protein ASG25_03055 [Rhizobium sp. Leaf384]|uniref:metallophosphoesterase family protein n=1 Tax=unclassified Rhizobium TaxID=2613769 RepID=UPI00071414E3|nr:MULTISPECIES: metallophosphoesterase family protein [unclassified Rhizobium]KQS80575.1 hypothetical protein ASG25_03055 [Rhizobium sp. Leaf384]KQS82513.1 hypothetical protein ASG58_03875 [Rhizobium sp. Leaf383]
MNHFLQKLRRRTRPGPTMRRHIDLTALDPRGLRLYVIPDVHGCIDALLAAEDRILHDMGGDETPSLLIYLGDYVDRGPQSARVLDHLISTTLAGTRRITLCGNHDDLFLRAITGRMAPLGWIDIGGRETLKSYGLTSELVTKLARCPREFAAVIGQFIPASHITFLASLPVTVRIGKSLLFVHAGILPGRPLEYQKEEHLMWIREPFLSTGPRLPLTVVHGHTIVPVPIFVNNRIGLDTGAYLYGRLAILKMTRDGIVVL